MSMFVCVADCDQYKSCNQPIITCGAMNYAMKRLQDEPLCALHADQLPTT